MNQKAGEYSFKELYEEIKNKVKEKGVQSDYEYADLIDQMIKEKKTAGLLSEDEDLEQLKDDLMLMWPEIEKELQE